MLPARTGSINRRRRHRLLSMRRNYPGIRLPRSRRISAVRSTARLAHSQIRPLTTLTGLQAPFQQPGTNIRSEERRVVKERVRTCRSRGSPYDEKKNTATDDNEREKQGN